MPSVRTPPCGLGMSTPRTAMRPVVTRQQSGSNRRPVPFQMIFELGHREFINTRCALVLDHPLIRELQVAAFHYSFHQARCRYLRFRPRTVSPGPPRHEPQHPPDSVRPPPRPPDLPDQLLLSSASLRFPPPTRGPSCSALRFALTPTMASADFWRCLPTPSDVSSTRHTARSPRVLTHAPSRLCLSDLRRRVPCKYRASQIFACSPRCAASIRFLFVRPALCLQLPPDSQSPATPLPFS